MIVRVSMTNEKEEFRVYEWWSSDPKFVIAALQDQLTAAKAIWPVELKGVEVCVHVPDPVPATPST